MSQKKKQSDGSGANEAPVRSFPGPRFHLRVGWASLLVFLTFGIVLEGLHAFRAPSYMNVGDAETRRLMWTLAHAHGTLFGLVHVGLGSSFLIASSWTSRSRALASYCLTAGGILMPLGFFVGGLFIYEGDPGLGVFLVPPGAVLVLIAVLLTVTGVWNARMELPEGRS